MSIKSDSRFSARQTSQSHLPLVVKTPRVESGLRPVKSSALSLLSANRGSTAFTVRKAGFKIPRYQNSYRLVSYNPFKYEVAFKILQEVMSRALTGIKYDSALCIKLCRDMSAEVQSRIHKKDFDRYKCIVTCTIFEKTGQSINMGMGRLWDPKKDTDVTHSFENSELIAVGTVMGLYYE